MRVFGFQFVEVFSPNGMTVALSFSRLKIQPRLRDLGPGPAEKRDLDLRKHYFCCFLALKIYAERKKPYPVHFFQFPDEGWMHGTLMTFFALM